MGHDVLEDELGIGAGDMSSPAMRGLATIRKEIEDFIEKCANSAFDNFSQPLKDKVEEEGLKNELMELLRDCFSARHGAHLIGTENVLEKDAKLRDLFVGRALSFSSNSNLADSLDFYYAEQINKDSPDSLSLAAWAEKTGTSAEPQR